jgi:hypothetical protein
MVGLMPAARAAYDDMVNTFRALLHTQAEGPKSRHRGPLPISPA